MKWAVGSKVPFLIEGQSVGIKENWIKAGFDGHDSIVSGFYDNKELWININKKRFKKRFNIDENGNASGLQGAFEGYADCEAEFTEVLINEQIRYYTLGFEALTAKEKCLPYLDAVLAHCMSCFNPEILHACRSIGYAEMILDTNV
jgi:hypothetical protein